MLKEERGVGWEREKYFLVADINKDDTMFWCWSRRSRRVRTGKVYEYVSTQEDDGS